MGGGELEGCRVMVKVDNMALSASLRSGRCEQKATMALLQEIFVIALERHLDLVPDWIPSAVNDLADALSRFDHVYISSHHPHVNVQLPVHRPIHTSERVDYKPSIDNNPIANDYCLDNLVIQPVVD